MSIKIELPAYVTAVLERLTAGGYEAFAVGGCLRDSLLGFLPKDYDIATAAKPSEISCCFSNVRVVETAARHGTVTVFMNETPVEVTTYRIDGDYSDHRHPVQVSFTDSIEADLSRRDFTINAMAYRGDGGLIDPFGGAHDLEARLIRAVGEPSERFAEDALRIMRALRFSSALDFSIEERTEAAIFAHAGELGKISAERLASELVGIIMGRGACHVLIKYAAVLAEAIPEIKPSIGFNQQSKYHKYTVWEHIAVAVSCCPREKTVRLAMLFHDLGKPACFKADSDGRGHFKGHKRVSAVMAGEILRRLRFDTVTIRRVTLLVENHDRPFLADESAVKKMLQELGTEAFFQLLDVQRADTSAKEEFCRERLPFFDSVEVLARGIIARGDCFTLAQLAVNGRDCMAAGLDGKAVGAALHRLLAMVIDGEAENERAALLALLKG